MTNENKKECVIGLGVLALLTGGATLVQFYPMFGIVPVCAFLVWVGAWIVVWIGRVIWWGVLWASGELPDFDHTDKGNDPPKPHDPMDEPYGEQLHGDHRVPQ